MKSPAADFSFETYVRRGGARELIYVRFLDASGGIVATRSTGETDRNRANAQILRMLSELDLPALAAARAARRPAAAGDLGGWPVGRFLAWFWSPASDYVQDRAAAGKPLTKDYLADNAFYVRTYVAGFAEFSALPLRSLSFAALDRFFRWARSLRQVGHPERPLSPGMLLHVRDLIRSAVNWASARDYCREIDLSGLVLPTPVYRERALLTDAEVERILALPTQRLWRETTGERRLRADVKPRPKVRGFKSGARAGGDPGIDIRMKAFVLLGPFLGLRRGEERGLRWESVDLEAGTIRVENNWIDSEGDKDPKLGSFGLLPIAPELEVVLWELREVAKAIKLASPRDYILFNPLDPGRPAAETTLRRGWERIMRAIGISDAERRARNLVPHGTRHRFATKLVDAGLSPAQAQKLTRHKTLAMLARYSSHISAETMEEAKRALGTRGKS